LPEEDDVVQLVQVGDVLRKEAGKKRDGLAWFTGLTEKQQEEVVGELNRYTFELNDHVKVAARVKDDYDMRWAFAGERPQVVKVRQPKVASGLSKGVEVAIKDCQTEHRVPENNDQRRVEVTVTWLPDTANGGTAVSALAEGKGGFTMKLEYPATPEWDNFVPRQVEKLDGIQSVRMREDGSVVMRCYSPLLENTFRTQLWMKGKDYANEMVAKPSEYVAIVLVEDALGAGASVYTFQGVQDGVLRFEHFTWFYNVMPATRSILEVRPYESVEREGK
jgi:hypothetical protein